MSWGTIWIIVGITALLLLFAPARALLLRMLGARSFYSLIWSVVSSILVAHWTVLRNFLPRSFVFPTLEDGKNTNAED